MGGFARYLHLAAVQQRPGSGFIKDCRFSQVLQREAGFGALICFGRLAG